MTVLTRRTTLVATALLASAALAACSQGSTGSTPAAGGDSGTKKNASDIVVGYAGPTLTNAFFVGLEKGVKDGAKANGFQLKETNANGDAAQQFNDATNLLDQGVDVLVLTPIDSNGITPVVQAANQKNVPVFTLDRGASGGTITCFVETDNKKAGEEAASWIAEQLSTRYGKPQGNVVDLVGLVGTTAAADRETGFQTGLKANPGLKIVAKQEGGFDQEKSLNAMSNILQANSKIDAVFGANDDNTVGALRAIDSANRFQPPWEQVPHPDHRSGWHCTGAAGHSGRKAGCDDQPEPDQDGGKVDGLHQGSSRGRQNGSSARLLAEPAHHEGQHRLDRGQGLRNLVG